MITLKGRVLTFTGKDEKLLRQYAKEANTTPRKFILDALKKMMEKYTFLDKDITLEKLK